MVTSHDVGVETCSVGVVTDPDCLGPCEPGSSVTLEGIIWQETDNGELCTTSGKIPDRTMHVSTCLISHVFAVPSGGGGVTEQEQKNLVIFPQPHSKTYAHNGTPLRLMLKFSQKVHIHCTWVMTALALFTSHVTCQECVVVVMA